MKIDFIDQHVIAVCSDNQKYDKGQDLWCGTYVKRVLLFSSKKFKRDPRALKYKRVSHVSYVTSQECQCVVLLKRLVKMFQTLCTFEFKRVQTVLFEIRKLETNNRSL